MFLIQAKLIFTDITVMTPAHDQLAPPRFKNDNIFSTWLPSAMKLPIMFASMLMTASRALAGRYSDNRYEQYVLHYKAFVLQLLGDIMNDLSQRLSDETLARLVSIKW